MPPIRHRDRGLRLTVGDGRGQHAAEGRRVELVVLPTSRAIDVLHKNPEATSAILHVTCSGALRAPFPSNTRQSSLI